MIINIGSKNPAKTTAIEEAVRNYDCSNDAEFCHIKADSEVADQPRSFEETFRGAKNRAKNAFNACDLSVGLESGIMEMPENIHMNFTVCALYDGKKYFLGISSGFVIPTKVIDGIINQGLEMQDAVYKAGLTHNPKIGSDEGIIGVLTKGRLPRKDYAKQAVFMALTQMYNQDLY
ncbi:inosine/xanthosine triphosphatase [Candidatus Woesearchaeota archaeon]|nr:inosine/xanthosine triphosphatase [Candidatus Woesearchaeota archaeon]MBW3005208.1 inosine/xanthosine triphosphatase [Candidatus Woesearchaeota archaeon]